MNHGYKSSLCNGIAAILLLSNWVAIFFAYTDAGFSSGVGCLFLCSILGTIFFIFSLLSGYLNIVAFILITYVVCIAQSSFVGFVKSTKPTANFILQYPGFQDMQDKIVPPANQSYPSFWIMDRFEEEIYDSCDAFDYNFGVLLKNRINRESAEKQVRAFRKYFEENPKGANPPIPYYFGTRKSIEEKAQMDMQQKKTVHELFPSIPDGLETDWAMHLHRCAVKGVDPFKDPAAKYIKKPYESR